MTALTLAESKYPLSTDDNKYIPLDVLGPISIIIQAITTASLGAVIPIPDPEYALLEVRSTVLCVLGFTANPVDLAAVPGEYILPANESRIILPVGSNISAITPSGSGTLYVNILRRWSTLAFKVDRG